MLHVMNQRENVVQYEVLYDLVDQILESTE